MFVLAFSLFGCDDTDAPALPKFGGGEKTVFPDDAADPHAPLDPHEGTTAVAVNDDGSLKCDAADPELAELKQLRAWLTPPATKAGKELFVVKPVYAGRAQNGQAGKCVDSDGNVLFADHIRFTTATDFVAPVIPPADAPWYDGSKWGAGAKGKASEIVATADDLRVMCFNKDGARCVPTAYEHDEGKVSKGGAKKIVITVPEGTSISVESAGS